MTPAAQQKMLEQTTIGVRVLLNDTCSPTKNVGADNNRSESTTERHPQPQKNVGADNNWSEVLLNDICSSPKNVGADNNWSEVLLKDTYSPQKMLEQTTIGVKYY